MDRKEDEEDESGEGEEEGADDGSDWAASSDNDDDDDDDDESDYAISEEEELQKTKKQPKKAPQPKKKAPPSKKPAQPRRSAAANKEPTDGSRKQPAASRASGSIQLPNPCRIQRPLGLKHRLQPRPGVSPALSAQPEPQATPRPITPAARTLPRPSASPSPLPSIAPPSLPRGLTSIPMRPSPALSAPPPLQRFRPPVRSAVPQESSDPGQAAPPPSILRHSVVRPAIGLRPGGPGKPSQLPSHSMPSLGGISGPRVGQSARQPMHQQHQLDLTRQFKCPLTSASGSSSELLKRKLAARRRFVPWGGGSPLQLPAVQRAVMPPTVDPEEPMTPPEDKQSSDQKAEPEPPVEPLVLWEDEDGGEGKVEVDPMLTRWLRPHQREGVKFMFECVCGLRAFEGNGCILADDMGLGKTLQGIALLWTLLHSGHESLGGKPIAKRVIIVCPTSLVNNWDSECDKWLKGRVRTLPLCESSRSDVIQGITIFLSPSNIHQVLIVSYETFRLHADRFKSPSSCDLLICDEAHRLKNDATLTNQALAGLSCKRRVLLSGTPLQNHLEEFYAMVNFCNPGLLGGTSRFHKYFELPIVAGREPAALDEEVALGEERMAELNEIVAEFILRRTNSLLSQHLPPKVIQIVCCRPTELQTQLYTAFLESKAAADLMGGGKTKVLPMITAVKKLCNHPKLVYDMLTGRDSEESAAAGGFAGCQALFDPWICEGGRGGGKGRFVQGWENLGGKFAVLAKMLELLRRDTNDRIVIVSNYTQTLDLVGSLCRERSYPFVRLDGSVGINKRQRLVKDFNDPSCNQFVFLLSSKAGGCGLNLIGGNRLVLFDPDWNPANDKQAAGRVWRDGQAKRVFVYRFLTTGTLEEKIYQRQLSKEGLQNVVNNSGGGSKNLKSQKELRNLFQLRLTSISDTYDSLHRKKAKPSDGDKAMPKHKKGKKAECVSSSESDDGSDFQGSGDDDDDNDDDDEEEECVEGPGIGSAPVYRLQVEEPAEEDLKHWGHNSSTATVPDKIMRAIGDDHVSFVFTCQVRGKPIAGEGELSQPEIIPSSPLSQAGTQPHPRAREKGEGGGDARKGRGQGRRTPGNGPDEEEKGHGDRIGDSDDGGTSPSRVSSGDEAKGNEDGDPSFSLSREVEPAGRAVLGSTGEEEEEEEMGMCGFEGALVAAEASQESPAPTQLQATQHAEPGGAEKEQFEADGAFAGRPTTSTTRSPLRPMEQNRTPATAALADSRTEPQGTLSYKAPPNVKSPPARPRPRAQPAAALSPASGNSGGPRQPHCRDELGSSAVAPPPKRPRLSAMARSPPPGGVCSLATRGGGFSAASNNNHAGGSNRAQLPPQEFVAPLLIGENSSDDDFM